MKKIKKKAIFIITILVICAISFGILRYLNSNYSMVLKMNWGFQMPATSKCIEIYENDTGDSFHGDGNRYHVFSYKSEDDIKSMFTWSSEENKTIYHSCYSEAVNEWLKEINVSDEQYPDYSKCVYWYDNQEDNSEIIVMWDSQAKKVYIVESFM